MNVDEEVFNYGELNEDHKKAAIEILNLLQTIKDPDIVSELIKEHFALTTKPKYDHSNSPFLKICEEINLPCNIQGWVEDNGVMYPLFILSGDIRKLDELIAKVLSNK